MNAFEEFIAILYPIGQLIYYFFSTLAYLIKMGINSISFLIIIIGGFINGFFEQLSIIGTIANSLKDIIITIFDYIKLFIGTILSIFSFFLNMADNGNDELF